MTDKQPDALRLAAWLEPRAESIEHVNAAALLRTQHKQIAAYKLLAESQEAQLSQHRERADKYREAIATLQSERDANAILTAAIERKDALLRQALTLCQWISETQHTRGSVNGLAAQIRYAAEQELSQ